MNDGLAAWLDTQGHCKMLWLEWNGMALGFLETGNWKIKFGYQYASKDRVKSIDLGRIQYSTGNVKESSNRRSLSLILSLTLIAHPNCRLHAY
jgi:hypothetical protein